MSAPEPCDTYELSHTIQTDPTERNLERIADALERIAARLEKRVVVDVLQ